MNIRTSMALPLKVPQSFEYSEIPSARWFKRVKRIEGCHELSFPMVEDRLKEAYDARNKSLLESAEAPRDHRGAAYPRKPMAVGAKMLLRFGASSETEQQSCRLHEQQSLLNLFLNF